MTTSSINIAHAKEEFSELVNRVAHHKERIILTRRGKEIVAIVPLEDLHLLQAHEDQSDLNEATTALKEARTQGTITLDALIQEIG